ncbi:MAG TPA: PrsW family glutamic-type intramembrane protease [Sphingomicrobium sp.]|nr:PrsW family glutamic-type intramembrane protease [Sphingomicrobium sp.]
MAFTILNWALALLPVLVLLALFVSLDVFRLMTWGEIIVLLLIGVLTAAVSYPISGAMLDTLPIGFSIYSRFVAPWIEEALKASGLIALFAANRIGLKLDAVISGVAIGAGFSVIENMIYLSRFPELGPSVWMVRGFGTAVMHSATVALAATIAHQFAERAERMPAVKFRLRIWWFLPGFLLAVAIHTAFNQFPDRPLLAMIGVLVAAPLMLMAIFRYGEAESEKWLARERDEHREALATLESGGFPDDESGRKTAALAARCDSTTADRIHEYVRLLTWLLVSAEEVLLKQTEDPHHKIHVHARNAFKRIAELKRLIGPATFAALRPLLPFSRNDYWEVSELRERL